MLVVYLAELRGQDQQHLADIDPAAHYWPRSHTSIELRCTALPSEWYISFSHQRYGCLWVLCYPELTRIIFRD